MLLFTQRRLLFGRAADMIALLFSAALEAFFTPVLIHYRRVRALPRRVDVAAQNNRRPF